MVEYGLLASKSSEIIFSAFGQLQRFLHSVPYGHAIAIGAGIAIVAYLLFRSR
jgi:Flp pilus assembly protein protease CpaA